MSTSGGRCPSNASISGALQDVWPPTTAFNFVAVTDTGKRGLLMPGYDGFKRTRAIFFYDIAKHSGFYTV